ncbi:MAG: hypothetical protein K2X66_12680 [Cyanobacteria bacterium]|nr:hypothetical protein [Cyanobacteriota bacterium]
MDAGETIIRFIGSFLFVIALLYGAYFYLKKNPKLLNFSHSRVPSKKGLQIESVLHLEARKNIYVIKSGKERFMIATSLEGTQFLSKLEEEEETVVETSPEQVNPQSAGETLSSEIPIPNHPNPIINAIAGGLAHLFKAAVPNSPNPKGEVS